MKYKLIKTYPGSPKLGHIDELNKTGHNNQGICVQPMYDKNPEFWQPVVEKDYEILSYINTNSKIIKCQDLDINDECNCSKYLNIYSIKRLSDNQIFTIGDFVNDRTISSFSLNWIQTGFKIHCDDVGKGNINDGCFFELKDLKHCKQPLLTTEDGVNIFENTNFLGVSDNLNIYNCHAQSQVVLNNSPNWKYFSTKEKAEEYILTNKPCLSINDVNVLKNIVFANWDKTLKDLVKSKI